MFTAENLDFTADSSDVLCCAAFLLLFVINCGHIKKKRMTLAALIHKISRNGRAPLVLLPTHFHMSSDVKRVQMFIPAPSEFLIKLN